MKKILLLTIFLGLLGGTLQAQSRAERRADEAEVARMIRQLVETGRYRIDVSQATPSGKQPINLSSNSMLIVRGDSVFSELPYYGNNYNMSFSEGLVFRGRMIDYEFGADRRDNSTVSFKVNTPEGLHRFTLRIMTNGLVDMNVTPAKRQMIRYQGVISTKPVD